MDWQDIPKEIRIAIAITTGVVGIGAMYLLYKKFKVKGDTKGSKDEVNAAKQELQDLKNQGQNPTFDETAAKAKVNTLVQAAGGCDPLGQGAEQIMNVIYSVKNKADWYMLTSTFGVQTWDECGVGTGDVSGSITVLLNSELDSGQMTEVRRHLGQFQIGL